ncbi:MAG: hypothetical protein WA364_13180 [Candidatus Nitrosopolaris sp.]
MNSETLIKKFFLLTAIWLFLLYLLLFNISDHYTALAAELKYQNQLHIDLNNLSQSSKSINALNLKGEILRGYTGHARLELAGGQGFRLCSICVTTPLISNQIMSIGNFIPIIQNPYLYGC